MQSKISLNKNGFLITISLITKKIKQMKLDRKEILSALETISVAGEGKNMVESGAVQNVITFGDEVVVDLL